MPDRENRSIFRVNSERRRRKEQVFRIAIFMATVMALLVLVYLVASVAMDGAGRLSWDFLSNFPSRFPDKAGIKSAIFGSIWLGGLTLIFSVLFGVGAAVYLQELANKNRLSNIIELSISTLAGVPSIIYGMLGLGVFVNFMALGRSVLAGALTMSLLVMPVIIIASREALKSVPDSIRMAAFALGATRWQTVRDHVLPAAIPGISTGVILAMARAMGEAAPLILLGALTYVAYVPEGLFDGFTALPIQIYNWTSRPQPAFHELAAAGIIVLLIFLLICNSAAIFIRSKWGAKK
ncbi:phosphate ABC transporter permease PstA [Oligoflexus tunisiensis]|uniref:phosphate ABC transporter permease PstA n=1 Tax=Oligoflexus tunisiensis TaxID=708132 RepID=UPI00114D0F0D